MASRAAGLPIEERPDARGLGRMAEDLNGRLLTVGLGAQSLTESRTQSIEERGQLAFPSTLKEHSAPIRVGRHEVSGVRSDLLDQDLLDHRGGEGSRRDVEHSEVPRHRIRGPSPELLPEPVRRHATTASFEAIPTWVRRSRCWLGAVLDGLADAQTELTEVETPGEAVVGSRFQ